jgi:hypothetical protein
LAKRLQKVISKLINIDQSAYIKGRYIVFDYCENHNEDSILLFLDFEKAFDTVEWNFMIETLKAFNFGTNVIYWIATLYNKSLFRAKNNWYVSKTCTMTRGIRQGCPISAFLFIITAEMLATRIRSSETIHDFEIGIYKEIKIIQHADDSTSPLKDVQSVKRVIKTVKQF